MGKIKSQKFGHKSSLTDDIESLKSVKPITRVKARMQKEEKDAGYVDADLSKKILTIAKQQQEELDEDSDNEGYDENPEEAPREQSGEDSEDEDNALLNTLELEDESYFKDVALNEDEERAFNMFLTKEPPTKLDLYEHLKQKLNEAPSHAQKAYSVDEATAEHFRQIGTVLEKYRSGKVPKGLKCIGTLSNWEHLLNLTKPDKWTAAAMFQATRILVSSLKDLPKDKKLVKFLRYYLLPRLRDDILEFKKITCHLYAAMKKATFKPASFYQGLILPLVQSGDCTHREAIIFGSILNKMSIPVIPSAVALMKIAELPYTGASSIFMRTLLAKKYLLPARALNAVVAHFVRCKGDKRQFPVLWHYCLLTLCQIYTPAMSPDQVAALKDLISIHSHHEITPLIKAELDKYKPPSGVPEQAMEQ